MQLTILFLELCTVLPLILAAPIALKGKCIPTAVPSRNQAYVLADGSAANGGINRMVSRYADHKTEQDAEPMGGAAKRTEVPSTCLPFAARPTNEAYISIGGLAGTALNPMIFRYTDDQID